MLVLPVVYSQSGGVTSFDLPIKNSLKFNKNFINPTFSFVREEIPYISILNKQQYSGFENAPATLLGSFSKKFQDNNAFSVAGFQKNLGLLSTIGGVFNYAINVSFNEESNLTFGLNIAAFKSGINTSKIITITTDPLLATFANQTLLSISPGINYGSGQIDFGLSANNVVFYNFSTSQTISNDPERSFQGHAMFTGYVDSNGFLDESKFTTLARAEKKKDKTIFAGNVIFETTKIGWLQAGYNTITGLSAGVGFNISNFSLGYNFEKTLGDAASLGNSHGFLLAYVFNDSDSNDSGVVYVKPKTVVAESTSIDKPKPNLTAKEIAAAKAKAAADAIIAKAAADKLLKDKMANDAKLLAETKAKAAADALVAKAEADRLLKEKIASNAKSLADTKSKAAAAAIAAKAEAERLLKEKGLSGAEALAAQKLQAAKEAAAAKAETDRLLKEKLINETKAKLAADALFAKSEADRILKEKTALNVKTLADAKAKAIADAAAAKAESDRLLGEKGLSGAQEIAAAKAKATTDAAAAKLAADRLLKEKSSLNAKLLADAKANAIADAAAAKAESDRLLKEKLIEATKLKVNSTTNNNDIDAKVKLAADKKVNALVIADAKTKAEQKLTAKLESNKAKAAADKIIKDEAIAVAKAKAANDKLAKDKLLAEAKAKADALILLKSKSIIDDKIKADASTEAKLEADKRLKEEAPKSDDEKSMDYINKILNENSKTTKLNLTKLDSTAVKKELDLKNLKEENDLSDKGVIKEPKPFVSSSSSNRAFEALKTELSESNKTQKDFLVQLEDLLLERQKKVPTKTDPINQKYIATIEKLKAEQLNNEILEASLIAKLEKIKTATDIEKKRRIKKAAFENVQGRYEQDRAALKRIKESMTLNNVVLTSSDFDFGSEDQGSLQILKKVENTQSGFYLILAVHSDVSKRDVFLTKVIASGLTNVDFFFDVNTSKYFIFQKKYEKLEDVTTALESKGSKPYNSKMFVVKVEN